MKKLPSVNRVFRCGGEYSQLVKSNCITAIAVRASSLDDDRRNHGGHLAETDRRRGWVEGRQSRLSDL